MKKDIVIISHFTDSFSEKDNDRFLYLAKLLSLDNDVEIVTSDFMHSSKSHRTKPEYPWRFNIHFLHEPGYKKNICLERFFSHFLWGVQLKKYLKKRKKPDIVYCAIPSLSGPLFVSKYCQKHHIKFIVDVQDLWPEAFLMILGHNFFSKLVTMPFLYSANSIYRRADSVCAVSQSYLNRALSVNKRCKYGTAVFIGTNLSDFDRNILDNDSINKDNGEFWLAYCGTLGSSYDIKTVIDALFILKKENYKIIFKIMGDGPLMQEFEDYASSLDVCCDFYGRVSYNEMCNILSKCDFTVNPIVKGSAASIINKHADYAAAGLPVINTQESLEYRQLVDEYKMGINCRPSNSEDIAIALKRLINNRDEAKLFGQGSRKCAEEKFDRSISYLRLIREIVE